jgi:hypothetical protein
LFTVVFGIVFFVIGMAIYDNPRDRKRLLDVRVAFDLDSEEEEEAKED